MEHIDNELIQVLSGQHLVARRDDRVLRLRRAGGLHVRKSRGPLDATKAR